MKQAELLFIALFLSVATITTNAQQLIYKQAYDVLGDVFTKAYHTNTLDGGMILLARSSNITGGQYFTIFKTQVNGDVQWSQRFIQPGNCNISNIIQLPDSGYFFCFVELNFPEKYYITRLDKNGNLIYCTSLRPPPNYIVAFDPQCISKGDGNVYVACDLHDLSTGAFGWHLFEIDASGAVVFSNCYNGGTLKCLERGFSICANGDLLMTGYQRDSIAMHYGPVITRIDSSGMLLWSHLFLDTTTDIAGISVFEAANGNIIATALHTSPGHETIRLETDSAGNLLRSRAYGSPTNFLSPFTSREVENGNMLIFGTTNAGSYALKLDSTGNILYSQRYYSIVPNATETYFGGYSFGGVDYVSNRATIFTCDSTLVSCSGDTITIDTAVTSFQTMPISFSYPVQLFDTAFSLSDTLWPGTNTKDCETIGVNELVQENGILVYPIPATDFIRIQCTVVPDEIQISDMSGKIILTNSSPASSTEIFTGSLAPGIYLLDVVIQSQHSTSKIIVE